MISKIRIRRFRSIDDLAVDCRRLTLFVGKNDTGKSNVVRALNLFFNGETDNGTQFDFERDFNKFSETPAKQAKEIIIEITFKLPHSFQHKNKPKFVVWKKVWRENGERSVNNPIRYSNNSPMNARSKIPTHLQRHFIDYVPAIKDQSFFANLLGKIYDKLSTGLTAASSLGIGTDLKTGTQTLVDDLNKVLDDDFQIGLPENLRPIFENLTIKNADGIPLDRRGDGIKIRHIPELLKFITEQTNKEYAATGAIKASHVWIFEEPENNLEFNAAFEMVNRLKDILSDTPDFQILVTTHSPVFYQMQATDNEKDTICHFVSLKESHSAIKEIDNDQLGEEMGLLPAVASAVKDIKQKLDDAEKRRDDMEANGTNFSKPHIFVEGDIDEKIFNQALKLFFDNHKDNIVIKCAENGGAEAAINHIHAWELQQKHKKDRHAKAVALLDDDKAAKQASKKLPENCKYIKRFYIDGHGTTKEIFIKKYKTKKDLESLYSNNLWKHARNQGWLEEIAPEKICDNRLPKNIANKIKAGSGEKIDKWKDLCDIQRLRVEYQFSQQGKKQAAQYITEECSDEIASEILCFVKLELGRAIEWITKENAQEELVDPWEDT